MDIEKLDELPQKISMVKYHFYKEGCIRYKYRERRSYMVSWNHVYRYIDKHTEEAFSIVYSNFINKYCLHKNGFENRERFLDCFRNNNWRCVPFILKEGIIHRNTESYMWRGRALPERIDYYVYTGPKSKEMFRTLELFFGGNAYEIMYFHLNVDDFTKISSRIARNIYEYIYQIRMWLKDPSFNKEVLLSYFKPHLEVVHSTKKCSKAVQSARKGLKYKKERNELRKYQEDISTADYLLSNDSAKGNNRWKKKLKKAMIIKKNREQKEANDLIIERCGFDKETSFRH